MAQAILLNRKARIKKMPDFEYSGSYSILDDGQESRIWQIVLLESGVLTIPKRVKKVTIKIQGGGGSGGASNGSIRGADGYDGTIQTLSGQVLEADTYSVTIGSAGARPYDRDGYSGGYTYFGSLLSASGGSGGEYAGSTSRTHSSIYGTRGYGGTGGTTSMYTGSQSTVLIGYYVNSSGYADIRSKPGGGDILGRLYPGDTVVMADRSRTQASDGTYWLKTASGGYIPDATCNIREETADTRSWYGNAGTDGVVLISGEL